MHVTGRELHAISRSLPALIVIIASSDIAAKEAIVIDPTMARTIAIETPMFGYRAFPDEMISDQKGRTLGFPTELIYTSAIKIPELQAIAAERGIKIFELDANSVVQLMRSLSTQRREISDSIRGLKSPWNVENEAEARFIASLLASELVDDDFDVFEGSIGWQDLEMISVEENVAKTFSSSYRVLEALDVDDITFRSAEFQQVTEALSRYPMLLEAARVNFAPVSFGEIFSVPADYYELEIPPPVLRKYDVYWVEFPVSLRNLERDNVTEVSFSVFLPEHAIALDLHSKKL